MSYENDDPFNLGGSGARTATLASKGDTVSGILVAASIEHDREYDPSNPGKGPLLYWSTDGKKTTTPTDRKLTYSMFVVQAYDPSDDDDGKRAIRVNKPRMKDAIKSATAAAGTDRMGLGGWLSVTMTGKIPGRGSSPANGYSAEYFTPDQVAEGKAPERTASKPGSKDDDPFA